MSMMQPYPVTSSRLSHPGRKRENNEDFVSAFEPSDVKTLLTFGSLFIVADGVGGASKGEKASQYATQRVLHDYYSDESLAPGERLNRAIRNASRDIYDYSQSEGAGSRMATTIVAALILNNQLIIANVGDSRAYLIRGEQIQQITRDHNYAGELVHDGVMTEEEALHIKGKNRLSRSVGGESDVRVDLFEGILLQPGDQILLCSDGLSRYALKEDILASTIGKSPDEISGTLVDFANRAGGADNISVISIAVGHAISIFGDTVITSQRQQQLPNAVDWDSMVTDYSKLGPVRQRSKKKIVLPWIILAVLIFIGIGVVSILFIKGVLGGLIIFKTPKATPEITQPVDTGFSVQIPTTNPIAELLPTSNLIPTLTPEPVNFPPSIVECLCPYLEGGGTIIGTLSLFGLDGQYLSTTRYFYRSIDGDTFSERLLITNHQIPNSIAAGEVIPQDEFYFVVENIDYASCVSKRCSPYP